MRVARRLAQELDDHIEAFVGMMDNQILVADGGEAITAEIADALGEARIEGHELEVREIIHDQFVDVGDAENAVDAEDVGFLHAGLSGHESAQRIGNAGIELKADDVAAAPPLQRAFEHAHQVFGLFFDFDVAVPQDPETALRLDLEAGEQVVQEHAHHVFQADEAHAGARQPREAADVGRQRDEPLQRFGVFAVRQFERDGESLVGKEGKRMRRIDCERGQKREDMGHEGAFQPVALLRRKIVRLGDDDVLPGEQPAQLEPARLLPAHQLRGVPVDRRQLTLRRQPVLTRHGDTRLDLAFEAGNAHHVEFVEVLRRNRQETDALQQRVRVVVRFLEHAAIEREPGEFAVDEPVGRIGRDRGLGLGFGERHKRLHRRDTARGPAADGPLCGTVIMIS